MTPDVSICVITYNQAQFIEKCIQSILMQQVNFTYEIVVGEDCSQDETPAILKNLQTQHPDKIKLFLNEVNMGRKGGNNFQRTLKACAGRYIATLDGDDYWINPTKLQQQYDFLETHPDYAICFHNVQAVDGETGQLLEINPVAPDTMTLKDVCKESYIHTSSHFFRNVLGSDIDEWLGGEIMAQDWPLQIYVAQYGKAKFINEIMSHRTVTHLGNWNGAPPEERYWSMIIMVEVCNKKLKGIYFEESFKQRLSICYLGLFDILIQKENITEDPVALNQLIKVLERLLSIADNNPVLAHHIDDIHFTYTSLMNLPLQEQ